MGAQLLVLTAQTAIMAILAVIAIHFWLKPSEFDEMEESVMDSDGCKHAAALADAEESTATAIRMGEDGIVELRAHRRRDFVPLRQAERRNRIYVDEMWKIIKDGAKGNEINNFREKFEVKLEDTCGMKLLRKHTANSGRQMAGICRCVQDQWFSVMEACKHSVYVNNLNLKTNRKELMDHFAACGTIAVIEFFKDTVNCRFIGMNSARIEFFDKSAKLKAMNLAGTLLNGSAIDVTDVPTPHRNYHSR